MNAIVAGRIEVIVGPMFAGKTTEMLKRVYREELAHHSSIIVKYDKDKRYSNESVVVTHDLESKTAVSAAILAPLRDVCMGFEVIGIDEGQFYPDIVDFAVTMANNGKIVIVAALDGDFLRRPIGHVLELMSKCESITKLCAICSSIENPCSTEDAPFTRRKVQSDKVELIGGSEIYEAVSRSILLEKKDSGSVQLLIGPVKSGKTRELTIQLTRFTYVNRKAVMIVPSGFHPRESNRFKTMSVSKLPNLEEIKEFDIIGVDNAEKFDGIADWADMMANEGKRVIVSAMDGDYEMVPYPEIVKLFPRCEAVNKLDSVCPFTGAAAPFSMLFNGIQTLPVSRVFLLHPMDWVLPSSKLN